MWSARTQAIRSPLSQTKAGDRRGRTHSAEGASRRGSRSSSSNATPWESARPSSSGQRTRRTDAVGDLDSRHVAVGKGTTAGVEVARGLDRDRGRGRGEACLASAACRCQHGGQLLNLPGHALGAPGSTSADEQTLPTRRSAARPGSDRNHPRVGPAQGPRDRWSLFAVFLPQVRGALDDHVEGWFLSYEEPPAVPAEGPRVGGRPGPLARLASASGAGPRAAPARAAETPRG